MLSLRPATHKLLHRSYIVFLCLCAPFLTQAGFSQADTATVSGTVLDTTDAGVPGASIDLENTATGVDVASTADKKGIFLIVGIRPGRYELSVSKEGFATTKLDDIVLNVGDQKVVQIKLKVGSVSNVVDVNAGGPTINTTDAAVGTVIDRRFVDNIPLNGRSFQDLISMTPGVTTQSPQSKPGAGSNGDFSVNGQRTESNYYTVDGVSGNANGGVGYGSAAANGTVAAATVLGTTQSLLSVDSMQEFRVQSSTYSAEYGNSPGGQFSLVSRSGTNEFHGTAFDYLRNNFFDANDWFNDYYGKPTQALRQNDFGGTIGGPIRIPLLFNGTNKSFFFISYEGLRLTQPQAASIQYVPDMALRQSASATLQPILNAYPLPTPGGIDYGLVAQFIEPYSLPSHINSTSVRIDQTFAQRWSAFFRFSDTPSVAVSQLLSVVTNTSNTTRTYTLGLTGQLSNSVTNDFRLGYIQSPSFATSSVTAFDGAVPADLTALTGAGAYKSPAIDFTIDQPGAGLATLAPLNSKNREDLWNLVDILSIAVGHHVIKAGIDSRRLTNRATPYDPLIDALYLTSQSVVNNSTSVYVGHYLPYSPVFHDTALFAQDEWNVNARIKLSLGLRWEVDPPPTAANGNLPYTALGNISVPSSLTLAPKGTSLWSTSWYNFAPRLGVAWLAHKTNGWQTVLRTGGGVFFDSNNKEATAGYNGVGFSMLKTYSAASLPVTASQLNFTPTPTVPYSPVYVFPSHLQLPYTLQWNTSLEQAIGPANSLTISYVGANGRRLMQEQELSLASHNSQFGTVFFLPTNISASYNALQVELQRSVSKGIQALASYTWSHSLDFGSTYSAFPAIRGNSDFDVRNSFTGGLTWDLPPTAWPKFSKALLNDWGIDARLNSRGAFPITLQGKLIVDPSTGNEYYGNVDLVPWRPLYLYGSKYPGGRAINGGPSATNPAVVVPTGSIDPGNAPRNFVRGFGATQLNVAARRTFPLFERTTLQFRAEAFNLLNHPNFGYVDPTLTDATFGTATKMLNQSLGPLSSQYQQGGPRSMQFALKLLF